MRLREAVSDDSLNGKMDAVRTAVREKWGNSGLDSCYVYASVIYDDHVIVSKDDDLFSVDYEFDTKGEVTFTSEPVKVKVTYTPISEAVSAREAAALAGATTGAVSEYTESVRAIASIMRPIQEGTAAPTGIVWDVILIESGLSQNRNFYSRELLEGAISKYEGARCFMDHAEEQRRFGRSGRDVLGFVKDVKGVMLATESDGEQRYALAATAVVTKATFRQELLEAYQHGKPDLFGLSHDVKARGKVYQHTDGSPAVRADAIEKVESVDYVVNPAAGGRVLRMVASVDSQALTSLEEDGRMIKKFLESLKALGRTDLLTKLGDNPTEEQVLEALTEALRAAPARSDTAAVVVPPVVPVVAPVVAAREAVTTDDVNATTMQEAREMIATLRIDRDLLECALPKPVKDRIAKRLMARVTAHRPPTTAEITEEIREAVEDYGQLVEAKLVMPHVAAGIGRIEVGDGPAEKTKQRLDDFFDPSKRATSFREMYVEITGDKRITGSMREATRLTESLTSTSFDQALGDSITRRMLQAYTMPEFANWRAIAKTGPLNDFRLQRRIRFGGYGNLTQVNQGMPYLSLSSPTDEEATYSPAKRGGVETLTLEMIRNDDVNVVREIPTRIARAAAQTLYEFVWDFLRTNSAIYDAVALAAVGHGNNISTTALSWTQWETLRLAMREQTDMSSGKRIGLKARYCIVPPELEQLAYQLFASEKMLPDTALASTASPAAPNFARTQQVQVICVDYWSDTNNYWQAASPDQTPMIEVGFLDGREEPELFVQDMPNVGSMFSNDSLTYKIRHIYGGAVLDFRGFAGGIVP